MDMASSIRRGSSETVRPDGAEKAFQAASLLRQRWRTGEVPDLARALTDEPGLREHRTLVIELAYEEYRFRLRAGECLTAEEFARRFPWLERSLCLYIAVQSLVGGGDPLLSGPDQDLWPKPGDSFLGFSILSELGRGAFGRVYQASERALGNRQVVLKVAWQGGQEAAILGRLRHPNIVPIYSIQEDEATGLTGFCMPLLGQATLSTVIDSLFVGKRLPHEAGAILRAVQAANAGLDLPVPPESPAPIFRRGSFVEGAVYVAAQLAEALAHAHLRGIYHRDLKPSNILMSPEARPLLLDFNLSIDEALPIARLGGTLPYMAPEELAALCESQGNAWARRFDPRSDLFSLGVILYELLAGKLPFGTLPGSPSLEETVAALRARQAAGPPAVEAQNPQVDRRLAALVHRMLAVDPEQRPPDARQLAGALRKELSLLPRIRRRLVRHWRKVLAGATATLLLIAVAAIYLALRPSYAERQLRAGIAHYEAGDYDLAVNDLTDSLKADPSCCEAYLARARAWKRQGDYQAAIADLDEAIAIRSSDRTLAAKAYCLNKVEQHLSASASYQQSLENDKQSPIVWNNLGFSYLKLGQFGKAEESLEQAVAIDDTLQAPHFNLVGLYVLRDHGATTIPAKALEHARRALEIGPETPELDRNVATLYAIAARHDKQWTGPAIRFTERAMARGADARQFLSDGAFADLLGSAEFQAALKQPADLDLSSVPSVRLLDPLP
jgi:serine/threonine protein kinase/Tfp pilus assembly protein PilF